MQGFLNEVAERLYHKYGAEVSSLKLIFPSRRSRIFFTEALSAVASEPLWQPSWLSLDDLTQGATELVRVENVRLIAELYKIYYTYHKEDFDKFYFWGEILLSDFDMIDKYLVDADLLFSNVASLKEIEADVSYMTPQQLKTISFWSALQDGKELSKEKQRFLKVWESLPKIYHTFKARLTELGIGYTGMIQRAAVERIKLEEFGFEGSERYAVVGFNALSECEREILDALNAQCRVDFFWDYDNYYLEDEGQEAGLFLRQNLKRYSSQFEISHNNFAAAKSIEVVAAASNVLQCKYASKIVSDIIARRGGVDKETAIVLTDENLLTPLLYALPEQAGKVNVTMGYPLKQSLASSLVERLLSLQSNAKRRASEQPQFYYVDVVGLLSHPYVNIIDSDLFAALEERINSERLISVDRQMLLESGNEVMQTLFTHCTEWSELSQYLQAVLALVARYPYQGEDSFRRLEFLATISQSVSTLHNSLEQCEIKLTLNIYLSLLRRTLQLLRVPFEGEPLEGLQVMGILETRNLDFRNVIMLSVADDNFPGNRLTNPSYVPYGIRAAYGIPTPEHHEGVFAYYFYRLMQRAENITLIYCSHADDKTTGEASRYIYQLDYESPFSLKYTDVGVDVNLSDSNSIVIPKEGEVDRILEQYSRQEDRLPISPSAINRYVACPLRFYFQHIARIKASDELSEDVDNSMFGNILHHSMQNLYEPLTGRSPEQTRADIERLRSSRDKVEEVVVAAVREVCHLKPNLEVSKFAADLLLIKDIIVKYIIDGVMKYDTSSALFSIVEVEQKHRYTLPLEGGKSIDIEGIIDRVDRLEGGAYRVIDYKSGGKHLEFKSIGDLFEGAGRDRQGHIIQTLTYSMMLSHLSKSEVVPSLYYVRFMHEQNHSPLLIDKSGAEGEKIITTYRAKAESFENHLVAALSTLLDRQIPFEQAKDKEGTCSFCDFRAICRV